MGQLQRSSRRGRPSRAGSQRGRLLRRGRCDLPQTARHGAPCWCGQYRLSSFSIGKLHNAGIRRDGTSAPASGPCLVGPLVTIARRRRTASSAITLRPSARDRRHANVGTMLCRNRMEPDWASEMGIKTGRRDSSTARDHPSFVPAILLSAQGKSDPHFSSPPPPPPPPPLPSSPPPPLWRS